MRDDPVFQRARTAEHEIRWKGFVEETLTDVFRVE